MNLILVRHGETDGNRDRRYIGRTDLPLNRHGHEQIAALGRELSAVPIHRVFYSPLQRTAQTAEIVMQHQRTLLTTTWNADPRLLELNFGRWEGLTFHEIEQQARDELWAWYDDPWHLAPPGGESLQALDHRLTSFTDELLTTNCKELPPTSPANILLVSHGGPLRWLLAKYLHRDTEQFHNIPLVPGQHLICEIGRGDGNGNGDWKLTKGVTLSQ